MAADPATRSPPARLAEAGPWWDPTDTAQLAHADADVDVSALEAELDGMAGQRPMLQQRARQPLAAEGQPVTRLNVIQRAVHLLHSSSERVPANVSVAEFEV